MTAALVEESAAASDSLSQQSEELEQLVGFFKVGANAGRAAHGADGTEPQLRLVQG